MAKKESMCRVTMTHDDNPYMKSSSISLTELYVGLTSSSSSSSALRNESYERAAFSALRASASSRSAFFCSVEFRVSAF